MVEGAKKYKINDYLNKLNVKEYRKAVKIIPKILGVSLNTFHNYRNISLNDTQDIPHEKVVIIEQLFDIKCGELSNRYIAVKRLEELLNQFT